MSKQVIWSFYLTKNFLKKLSQSLSPWFHLCEFKPFLVYNLAKLWNRSLSTHQFLCFSIPGIFGTLVLDPHFHKYLLSNSMKHKCIFREIISYWNEYNNKEYNILLYFESCQKSQISESNAGLNHCWTPQAFVHLQVLIMMRFYCYIHITFKAQASYDMWILISLVVKI